MRWFLSRNIPPRACVLLVESGSRHLLEDLLPKLYAECPEMWADVLTCYSGAPAALHSGRGSVYSVNDYSGLRSRLRLLKLLAGNGYTAVGIVCSAEPMLGKWKWAAAARIPAKVFVVNENGDTLWLDRGHWPAIRHFIAYRAGLTGAGAVRTLARLATFPVTLIYLLLYAATVHLKRKLRTL